MSLCVRDLAFSYHSSLIIKDLSFRVPFGEFVSLIGPSGCGKSTLFKIIGGVYTPQHGEIQLDQQRINGKRGHIGYMPQDNSLFPWYTIKENIRLGQRLNGSMDASRVDNWLKKAGLEGMGSSYPYNLSGGMQQRVAFIRTLAGQKKYLCMDEPFSALDALTRMRMYDWINSLHEIEKRTILFITHSVEEAMLLSDRIYILSSMPMKVIDEKVVPFPRNHRSQLRGDTAWIRLQDEIMAQLLKT